MSGGPVLALGTAQWGIPYGIANLTGRPPLHAVARMLGLAERSGISILDTARAYGESEEVLGQHLGGCGNWKIFTKLAVSAGPVSNGTQRQQAEESLAASRSALQRQLLDAVLLHRPADYGSPAWQVLLEEKKTGRIRRIGYSALTEEDAWQALQRPDVQVIQVAASLLDQRLLRSGWFERARQQSLFVVIRSVFLQGAIFLGKHEVPCHLADLAPALDTIDDWCESHAVSRAEVALATVRSLPVDAVLVGCETFQQLAANIQAWRVAHDLLGDIAELMTSISHLPAQVLDPSQWQTLQEA